MYTYTNLSIFNVKTPRQLLHHSMCDAYNMLHKNLSPNLYTMQKMLQSD